MRKLEISFFQSWSSVSGANLYFLALILWSSWAQLSVLRVQTFGLIYHHKIIAWINRNLFSLRFVRIFRFHLFLKLAILASPPSIQHSFDIFQSTLNFQETDLIFYTIVRLFTFVFANYHSCSYGHLSRNINKLVDFGGALAEKIKSKQIMFCFR